MKSRWWIATGLLVACSVVFQPGCGGAPELPSEPVEETEDPAAGMEVPPP